MKCLRQSLSVLYQRQHRPHTLRSGRWFAGGCRMQPLSSFLDNLTRPTSLPLTSLRHGGTAHRGTCQGPRQDSYEQHGLCCRPSRGRRLRPHDRAASSAWQIPVQTTRHLGRKGRTAASRQADERLTVLRGCQEWLTLSPPPSILDVPTAQESSGPAINQVDPPWADTIAQFCMASERAQEGLVRAELCFLAFGRVHVIQHEC